jgi:hypothetical protein
MLHRTITTLAMIGLLGAIANPIAIAAQKDSGSLSGVPSGTHDASAKGSDSVKGGVGAGKIEDKKGSRGGVTPVGPTTAGGVQKVTAGCPGVGCNTQTCRSDCMSQNPDVTTVDSAGNKTVKSNSVARANCVTNTCHP